MRGHEPIIAKRLRGWVPSCVWIDDGCDGLRLWRDWPTLREFSDQPHVEVEPKDRPKRLDLRFAAGLQVWLHGSDAGRVQALTEALVSVGAKRVLWSLFGAERGLDGQELCVAMGDTDGVMVWQR